MEKNSNNIVNNLSIDNFANKYLSMDKINRLKVGILTPITLEWFNLHSEKLEMVSKMDDADYIIYESNGDPVEMIERIKKKIDKKKLIFILSGDQSVHIDNECIWFTNAIKPSGLAKNQTQIFVTNPAIFKYFQCNHKKIAGRLLDNLNTDANCDLKGYDIYFKGTIWDGMRRDMYDFFRFKPGCKIEANNQYWNWRCNNFMKPSQDEIEKTAYDSYDAIIESKLCLCPKGNGNSSMRIIESIACGVIPVLINDFSEPFGIKWSEIGLVFDTRIHTWDYIYGECVKLISDKEKLNLMRLKCLDFFVNTVYVDYCKNNSLNNYKNLDTVAYGFSTLIVDKLIEIHNREKRN